jgi:two-component system response regulator YesN
MREASAIACLEPHYFSSVFHRQTTLSFTEWRMRLRVFRAVDLIATGEVSIDQAVERVGYDDRRSLERATKRLLGLTPKALRASRSAVRPSSSA